MAPNISVVASNILESWVAVELDLAGRTALVTGCSVGIGRAIANELAAEGVRLVAVARRLELLSEVQHEIVSAGGVEPLAVQCDLARPEAALELFDAVSEQVDHIDILVNNAGLSMPANAETPDDVWMSGYWIHFGTIRKLTYAFLPAMQERRWGRVFSIGGISEPPATNVASATKASTTIWAKSLSREVARFGVTVNCIGPGVIWSEQLERMYPDEASKAAGLAHVPAGRFGSPTDVAALVTFLSSDRAGFITGQRIDVDGGRRLGIF